MPICADHSIMPICADLYFFGGHSAISLSDGLCLPTRQRYELVNIHATRITLPIRPVHSSPRPFAYFPGGLPFLFGKAIVPQNQVFDNNEIINKNEIQCLIWSISSQIQHNILNRMLNL